MVSIIITNYNYGRYIGRCIRSCLQQKHTDVEVIVVDDCSTDNSEEIIKSFGDKVKFYKTPNNSGVAVASNLGIQNSSGQFIIRVDADDYVNENFIKFLVLHLELNNNLDAIACDYYMVDNEENVIEQKNCMKDPIACGILFRTDQIIDIGLYDEEFLLHEEKDLRIRFLKKYNIDRAKLPLYRYRLHENNNTKNLKKMKHHFKKLKKKHKIR